MNLISLLYIFVILNINIMKSVSLKIDQHIFEETEDVLTHLNKSRNKYINEAIHHYNQVQKRNVLKKKLQKESYDVREDSMSVLQEFENIDYVD